MEKLENFNNQFINIEHKRRLLDSIFPEKFQFENHEVRTEDINPKLLKIASINKDLKGNKKRDKSNSSDLSNEVLKTGIDYVEFHFNILRKVNLKY